MILGNLSDVGEKGIEAGQRIFIILGKLVRFGKTGATAKENGETNRNQRKKSISGKHHKRRNSELELGERDHSHDDGDVNARNDSHDEEGDDASDDDNNDQDSSSLLGHSYDTYSKKRSGKKRRWTAAIASLAVWSAVISVACTVQDLSGIAEIVGSIGVPILGFLLPCTSPFSLSSCLSFAFADGIASASLP